MSANGEINNTLKLDVSQFDQSMQKVANKLDQFDKGLDKTNSSIGSLEKVINGLSGVTNGLSTTLKILDSHFTNSMKGLSGVKQTSDQVSKSFETTTKSISRAGSAASKSAKNIESLADFTKEYEKRLKTLNPLLDKVTKGQSILEAQAKATGNELEKQSQKTISNNAKTLQSEIRTNEKILAERREMAQKAAEIQKRAEVNLAVQQKLYSGTFFGKNANSNSQKAVEMRQNIELWRKEADSAKNVKAQIESVIRDIEYQNSALQRGVSLLDQQLARTKALKEQQASNQNKNKEDQKISDSNRRRQELERKVDGWWQQALSMRERKDEESERKRLNRRKELEQEYSNWFNRELDKRDRREAELQAKNRPLPRNLDAIQAQRQTAADNRRKLEMSYSGWWNRALDRRDTDAQRASEQAQRQAYNARMQQIRDEQKAQQQLHKEQMQVVKDLTVMYASLKINQTIGGSVHKNMELEQAKFRLGLWNLPGAEQQRFISKSQDLTKTEKYLTQTEALNARLDAMAAMGGNHEKTIDATLATATRVAHVLRATGNETGSNSDLIKNLYGFAEARQVMNNPEEIKKSFDTIMRISNISNGKIKVADVETVARNMGNMRADVSADGWLQIAALAEQFKTAGGGNGGGGGVATVGTIFKMMNLYGSGKTITNRAVENLMGADILNDFKGGDAEKAYKENAKDIKEFTKLMKNAGFKDAKSMGENPVKYFASLRGQVLDYMMRDDNFARYFGQGTKRWSYNKDGQMVGADGKTVDSAQQNKLEQSGFTRWASSMGWSNRMVDGIVTMLNKPFIDRANEVAESAKKSADSQQALTEAQKTLKGSVDNLMASLGRLAEAFQPLLPLVTSFVETATGLVNVITDIASIHPAIASLMGLGAATGAVALTIVALTGKLKILQTLAGALGLARIGQSAGIAAAGVGAASSSIGGSFTTIASGATGAGAATGAAAATMSSKLLGLAKGAFWVTLAGMFGWAIGTWLRDIQAGGATLGQHTENLINDIVTDFEVGFNKIRMGWNSLLMRISSERSQMSKDALAAYADAQGKIQGAQRLSQLVRNRTDEDAQRAKAGELVNQLKQIQKSGKDGQIQIGQYIYPVQQGNLLDKNIKKLELFSTNTGGILSGGGPLTLASAGPLSEYNDITKRGGIWTAAMKTVRGRTVQQEAAEIDAKKEAEQKAKHGTTPTAPTGVLPTPSAKADYSAPPVAPVSSGAGTSSRGGSPRDEREWNNLFYADLIDLQSRAKKRKTEVNDLFDIAPNYEEAAKAEFIKRWVGGKFDDNNDPRSRKFTIGNYDKSKGGWSEDQINWNGMDKSGFGVQDWINSYIQSQKQEEMEKSVRYAAERYSANRENTDDLIGQLRFEGNGQSRDMSALKRQFARQEVRNPTGSESKSYLGFKTDAITRQASNEMLGLAVNLKTSNKNDSIDLIENQANRRKELANVAYNEELKRVNGVKKALQDQIKAYEDAGNTESAEYKSARAVMAETETLLTEHIRLENEKRIRNSESAFEKVLREYRDLQGNLEENSSKWGQNFTSTMQDVVKGKMSFGDLFSGDFLKNAGSSMLGDVADSFTKKAIGEASKLATGNSSIWEMGKSIWSGGSVVDGGWIGNKLNSMRGLDPDNPVTQSSSGLATAMDAIKLKFGTLGDNFKTLFASVGEASGGLWNFATNAVSQAISALLQWAAGLAASSSGSSTSGILSTVIQAGVAYFSGGSSGGTMYTGNPESASSMAIDLNAKGGAFTGYKKFAKGGSFTNRLFDSPTAFAFANGGSFNQLGVMGEAGPEAVMPLTRDSSGKLGVSMQGGMASNTQQNQVTISVVVNNDGNSTTSSNGDDRGEYKDMAKQIEVIVVNQLTKQSRPGGILYKK